MTTVVVSPHLDDAVLSCCARLLDGDVHLVTVCTGVPDADAPLSAWDAEGGATSGRERARERLAEDDAALAVLGVATTRLGELGQHYRGTPFDVSGVADRLVPLLAGADDVWAAAGIGGHGAHVGARDATTRAAGLAGVEQIWLYADLPYAIDHGFPDPDALTDELTLRGLDPNRLTARRRALSPEEQRKKQAALTAYRTQHAQLRVTPSGRFEAAEANRWELAWQAKTPGR